MEALVKIRNWIWRKALNLLTWDKEVPNTPFCDFERIRFEIRPGDVLLVEGRSRISDVIKTITLSRWTHAALYVGRVDDIKNRQVRDHARQYYPGDLHDHLLVEAVVEEGTVFAPLTKYQYHNLRICRPRDISPQDAQKVIEYGVNYVGMKYDTRQLLDLARFFFPYGVLPRKWRSSLFEKKVGESTRTICSTMLAEAFASVQFPVLPFVQNVEGGELKWFSRNSSLFIPSDFDYSPYFDIIKYPFFGDDLSLYRKLPWDKTGVIYSDEQELQMDQEKSGSMGKKSETPEEGKDSPRKEAQTVETNPDKK